MKLMLGECLCKMMRVCTMVRSHLTYCCGVRSSPPSTSYLPAMVALDPWISLGGWVAGGGGEDKEKMVRGVFLMPNLSSCCSPRILIPLPPHV